MYDMTGYDYAQWQYDNQTGPSPFEPEPDKRFWDEDDKYDEANQRKLLFR